MLTLLIVSDWHEAHVYSLGQKEQPVILQNLQNPLDEHGIRHADIDTHVNSFTESIKNERMLYNIARVAATLARKYVAHARDIREQNQAEGQARMTA